MYVCSHTNLLGPLAALCWLPFPVRPWVYHVFMEKGSCRAQYRDFTFPAARSKRTAGPATIRLSSVSRRSGTKSSGAEETLLQNPAFPRWRQWIL